ncbi:hypothetical protein LOK49_LG05G02633 [Camellia lanceoleosa]|uniref:Uncharacterized protein n=1 Tax=Camellia lanceoleosa TaxID=1840588 RepID=A0ACC0HSW5_9ERIC|nr:hypothetical protein LOK49_LG05G02633 [Camellia lanceoleosa]
MALSKNSRVLLFIAAFLTAILFLSCVSEAAIVARGPLDLGRKLLQGYEKPTPYSDPWGGISRPVGPP